MEKIYPLKFLDAYEREDKSIFFGRQPEIDALYEMVFQTDLLLIYGASGTGKTSLIQCGLANRFESHDWLDLYIRRGNNINESLEKVLARAGGSLQADNDFSWLNSDFLDTATTPTASTEVSPLAQRLQAIYLQHFKPIYLIFDQFEELYTLDKDNKQERDEFIRTIKTILQIEQPVKIIISIREEYLGYLYEFEQQVPELLRKKLRVEPMNLGKVQTVVREIGELPNSNIKLQAGEAAAIGKGIFDKIRGEENTLGIELPYLQVFMDKLYMQISGDSKRQADAVFSLAAIDNMGNIGDVLRDFLDEQVLNLATAKQAKPQAIWAVLSPFVTLEGTKHPLSKADLLEQLPAASPLLIAEVLQAFTGTILRHDEQEDVYEIKHDSLAKQIHAKRSDEEIALLEVQRLISSQMTLKANNRSYLSRKQLDFIAPFEEQLVLDATAATYLKNSKAHAKRQKRIRFGSVAAVFLLLSALLLFAIVQRNQAQEALESIEQNRRVNNALELQSLGDNYFQLEKWGAAKRTYKTALDSLGDARYAPDLHNRLQQKIESLEK